MPEPSKPRRYVVQKHIMAVSVQDALAKEAETPVTSVFPDAEQPQDKHIADAIGFKHVDAIPRYEY